MSLESIEKSVKAHRNQITQSVSQLAIRLKQVQDLSKTCQHLDSKIFQEIEQALQDCDDIQLLVHPAKNESDLVNLNEQVPTNSLNILHRQQLQQRLTEAIAHSQNFQTSYSLCYLDLDHFNIINEACGYEAGEQLLQQVSHLLRQNIGSRDTLAYLGGDEFAILFHQCTVLQGLQRVEILRQELGVFQFFWQEQSFSISASLGLVSIETHHQDWNHLLNAAELACHRAKQKGRNCYQVYGISPLEQQQDHQARQLLLRLNQALVQNHFCLYSQKITSLAAPSMPTHQEILLRLWDETGKLASPALFLPVAERYNLMPAIDRWVLSHFFSRYETFCQQMERENGVSPGNIYNINLSGASLNDQEFLSFVQKQFAHYQIPAETICFEITETTAIANLSQATQFITKIKELGCRFALDDFGTGMSSLAYLKHLPVDYLKIDGCFIKNILHDPIDWAMVECFQQISRTLGIKTVAEYVEDNATLEKLRELGINYAQGYAIDRPQPLTFSPFNYNLENHAA